MEISPSPAAPSAAAGRKLPPVRYHVPYQVEEKPVFDPDSPRSPSELRADLPPLDLPEQFSRRALYYLSNPPGGPYSPWTPDDDDDMEDEDPASSMEEEPPAVACQDSGGGGGGDQEMHLYYNYKVVSPSVRQSDKYAEAALRHYSGDPGNEVKYELVEAPGSNGGIMLERGLMLGHVNFTARAVVAAGQYYEAPSPFFAEVRYDSPYLIPTCVMSLDDVEEHLCPCCGDYISHPELHSELRFQNRHAALFVRHPKLRC